MHSRSLAVILVFFVLSVIFALSVCAAWNNNGDRVSDGESFEIEPCVAPDTSGGAYIAWEQGHENPFIKPRVFVQRINADGILLWGAGGISISKDSAMIYSPIDIAPDGTGGALVCWTDLRQGTSDIYAQRLDENGNNLWVPHGVVVYSGPDSQNYPRIVSDGAGGAIVVWRDDPLFGNASFHAQRIDASGSVLWSAAGVPVSTDPSEQYRHDIVSDGAGGVIVTWDDALDIYAQRIDLNGTVQWAADGIPICTLTGQQIKPRLVSDDVGGAIITWQDQSRVLYVQRVDADGNVLWAVNGVVVYFNSLGARSEPRITSDGSGGAVLCWTDTRTPRGIYAQRVDADGDTLWNGEAVLICEGVEQEEIQIVSDEQGGAAIAWKENREVGDPGDIFARAVDATGNAQGPTGGWTLCAAETEQRMVAMATDGAGGGIVAWSDNRNAVDTQSDIYASRVYFYGTTDTGPQDSPSMVYLSQNFPNPFNPTTTIKFYLPHGLHMKLSVFDVKGDLVSTIIDRHMTEGLKEVSWSGKDNTGRPVASGIYFYRLVAGDFVQTRKMVLLR